MVGAEYGPVAGSCEHGNEPAGSIKDTDISGLVEHLLTSEEDLCSI
jgi:hypothetical protein